MNRKWKISQFLKYRIAKWHSGDIILTKDIPEKGYRPISITLNSKYLWIRIAYAMEAHALCNRIESLIRIYVCHGNRANVKDYEPGSKYRVLDKMHPIFQSQLLKAFLSLWTIWNLWIYNTRYITFLILGKNFTEVESDILY